MAAVPGSNSTPVVRGSWRPVYTENAAPVAVSPALLVSDDDGATLSGATVRIGRGFEAGQDVLAFTAAHGISGAYDAATGVLSLSGTASLAHYQEVLRSVTYANTSEAPEGRSRKIIFQLDDGAASNNLSRESSVSLKVFPMNDAPALSHAGSWLLYPPGETSPQLLDATVNVGDWDSGRLKTAEIRITEGYVRGQDVLDFDGIDGIRLSARFDATTGTLTLRGRGTPEEFQEAIRNVTFQDTTGTGEGERTLSIRVSDGKLWSEVLEQRVLFAAPPEIDTAGASASHTEDATTTTTLAPALELSDVDDTELLGATVRIASGHEDGDMLVLPPTANIAASWDADSGTLTLSGVDTVANYEAALRSIGFRSTNENPSGTPKTITWSAIDDKSGAGAPVTSTLTVSPVNDAPTLAAGASTALTFTEDDAATFIDAGITLGDVDDANIESVLVTLLGVQPGDVLSYSAGTSGISGSFSTETGELALSGSASKAAWQAVLQSIQFGTTQQDPSATRTIQWTIHDGALDSNTVTRAIEITAVNDAPVLSSSASGDFGYTEDSAAISVGAALIVSDADDAEIETVLVRLVGFQPGDMLTWTESTNAITGSYNPATGELALTGPTTKAAWQAVLDTLQFSTTEQDPTASRTLEWTVSDGDANSNTWSRDIAIAAQDDAPVAVNDLVAIPEDASVTFDPRRNDTDVDGGPKQVASVTQPAHGTVTVLEDGGLRYQTNANYNNTSATLDTFTYTLNGGSTATVSMRVDPVDDAPVAVDDTATVTEDDVSVAIDVRANDTDIDGGPLSIASITQPANGSVSITGGGTGLTYTPNANYANHPPGVMPDTFTYTLNGGRTATVSVTVTAVDDAPAAVNDSATLTEDDGATAIVVLDNDTDVDGGPKSIASASDPAHGTVVLTGGSPGAHTGLSYQPDADFAGTDTFTYALNGGGTATVTVTVDPVDDAPVAVNDSYTVDEDSGAKTFSVLGNDTDIDAGPLAITAVTQPFNGTVSITNGGADLSFTPNANYFSGKGGPESFTYTLNGGSTATVEVTVNAVNDAPTFSSAAATSVPEAETAVLTVAASDVENETLSYSITGGADAALFTIDGSTGDLSFNAPPDFESPADAGGNNVYDVQVGAFDGIDTTTQDIAVTVTNGAPSTPTDEDPAANQVSDNAPIGSTLHLDTAALDPAGGSISFWLADDAGGLFEIDADTGVVTVAGAVVYDGAAAANNFKTITVVASDGALETTQDFQIEIIPNTPPAASDDTGTAIEAGGVSNGTAGANAEGNVITDGTADSDAEDVASALSVADIATGAEGASGGTDGSVGVALIGAYGTLTMQSDGSYVYVVDDSDPAVQALQEGGATLSDSFHYTLQDTGGLTDKANLVISINGANDAPSAPSKVSGLKVTEDGVQAVTLTGSDIDGSIAQFRLTALPQHGTLYLDAGLKSAITATGLQTAAAGELQLYYQPDADFNGADSFDFAPVDDSGAEAASAATQSIQVNALNDAPGFAVSTPTTSASEDAGAQTVSAMLTGISAGPADENGQGVAFIVSNDNEALFSVQPGIAPDGTLSYTPAADAHGTATVTVYAQDDGGTLGGGSDTSASTTFTISIAPVNDAPTFTLGEDPSITEGAGAQTVPAFMSAIAAGPSDESAQAISASALVSAADATMLFNQAPAIDPATGNLSYELTPDAYGTATVTVQLTDDGGTPGVPGDDAVSAVQTFTITAAGTPDAPIAVNDFLLPDVAEDSGPRVIDAATLLANDTDADNAFNGNAGLSVTGVNVLGGGTASFDAGTDQVTFTPDPDFAGVAVFEYTIQDATGNTSTGAAAFNVTAVNDAPAIAAPQSADVGTAHSNTVFSLADRVSVSDVDIAQGTGELSVTLGASHGGLTVATAGAASISAGANGSGSLTLTGTVADVNATLASLSYKSDDGWTGTETIQVSVSDLGNTGAGGAQSASTSFDIGVVEQVVFIDNTDTKADNLPDAGSAANPFNTIAAFNAGNVDGTGDYILVKKGTGTYNEADGFDLLASQKLYGEGSTFQLTNPALNTKQTFGTGNAADEATVSLTTDVGTSHVVDLGANNTVAGLNLATAASGQVALSDSGASVGTLNISNVTVTGVGAGVDIDQGGTLTIALDQLSSTGASGNAIDLQNVSGSVSVGAGGTVSGAGATLVNVANATVGLTLGSNLSTTSQTLLNVQNHATGTITLNGTVKSASGGGLQFTNADATYQVKGSAELIGGNASIGVLTGSDGTFTFGSGAAPVYLSGAGAAAFNMANNSANVTFLGNIYHQAGYAVAIDNHDGGTVTFQNGLIDSTFGGSGIKISNSNGGTVNFNTQVTLSTGTKTALDLGTSNSGGTVNFVPTGLGLDITTTTGAGFLATGGGTVSLTGTGNTITSTGGTALNVSNTTIGAADLTFHSISANGGSAGIILNNTGSSGGLTVTGTNGFANTGGTIQNINGAGIQLTSTMDVSLSRMNIQSTTLSGISGTDVTNFSLTNSTVNNSGTSQVAGTGNVAFNSVGSGVNNLDGVVTITGNTLTNAYNSGIQIYNESGTISSLTVSGNTLTGSGNTATSKGSGLQMDINGSAGTAAHLLQGTVSGNTVNGFASGAGIQVQGGNGAQGPAVTLGSYNTTPGTGSAIAITGNHIGNSGASNSIGTNGIATAVTGTGTGNFTISGNDAAHFLGIGVTASGGNKATVSYLIENNVIDATDNIASSPGMSVGSQLGGADSTQNGTIRATISGNTVNNMEGNGILAGVTNSYNTGYFKIVNNTVGNPAGGVRPGIRVESGSTSGDTTVYLEISGNTAGSSSSQPGIGLRKQGTVATVNKFFIEGLTPSPATAAQMESYVSGLNPNSVQGPGSDGVTPSRVLAINGSNFLAGSVDFILAAGEAPASALDAHAIATLPAIEQLLGSALEHWGVVGIGAPIGVHFSVADLPGQALSERVGNEIRVDSDAAGWGWFIDSTPWDDADVAAAGAARMDLLTVLIHELGHVIGLDDLQDPASADHVMFASLEAGTRKLPQVQDVPVLVGVTDADLDGAGP